MSIQDETALVITGVIRGILKKRIYQELGNIKGKNLPGTSLFCLNNGEREWEQFTKFTGIIGWEGIKLEMVARVGRILLR